MTNTWYCKNCQFTSDSEDKALAHIIVTHPEQHHVTKK